MKTETPPRGETPDSARELIERYVREVARRLQPKERADVTRELRSSLLDALEDRFGPEATWTQAAILLRETGSPRQVAASYRPEDQYLIGPEWYPTFRRVLRIALAAYAGALVLAFGVVLFLRPGAVDVAGTLGGLLNALIVGGFLSFASIVIVFHLLQRYEKPPALDETSWDPEELPPARESDLVGRGEAVLEVVLPAVFLVLLYAFRDRIGIPLADEGAPLLNDVFLTYLPWISAAILLDMAHGAVLVWCGRHTGGTRAAKLAFDLFGLWVFYRIAADVAAERATLLAAGLPEIFVDLIVRVAWALPVVIGVVILVGLGKLAVRTLRRPAEAW